MASFQHKEISNPLSLGERLKKCRQKSGVSLAKTAQATSISVKYLVALESGEYHKLPGEIYAKSFLKVYTEFLGLPYDEFLSSYQKEQKIYSITRTDNKDHKKPVERVSLAQLIVAPRIVRGIIIGLLVLACLIYLGVKVKVILSPPILIVEQPVDNLVTAEKFIKVTGKVEGEKEIVLKINGQQIFIDAQGAFSEAIDLQTGANIIEISAQKRHSKETKIYRQVVVVEEEADQDKLR